MQLPYYYISATGKTRLLLFLFSNLSQELNFLIIIVLKNRNNVLIWNRKNKPARNPKTKLYMNESIRWKQLFGAGKCLAIIQWKILQKTRAFLIIIINVHNEAILAGIITKSLFPANFPLFFQFPKSIPNCQDAAFFIAEDVTPPVVPALNKKFLLA